MTLRPRKPAKKLPYRKRRTTPKRFGVCLDSLHKIRIDEGYELVVIDESNQVLAHLLSETIASRGNQDRIYKVLREVVRRARHVVALDADLDYLTYNTLVRMVSGPDENGNLRPQVPIHLW